MALLAKATGLQLSVSLPSASIAEIPVLGAFTNMNVGSDVS